MSYHAGAPLLILLLFLNMNRHSSALVCTCEDTPGSRPPHCDFGNTCTVDDEIGLCTTGHNYYETDSGPILIVESACANKELNPNWRDYCSGKNSFLVRCCETDNCNREWNVYEYPTPEELSRYVPPTDGSVDTSTTTQSSGAGNGTLTPETAAPQMPATDDETSVPQTTPETVPRTPGTDSTGTPAPVTSGGGGGEDSGDGGAVLPVTSPTSAVSSSGGLTSSSTGLQGSGVAGRNDEDSPPYFAAWIIAVVVSLSIILIVITVVAVFVTLTRSKWIKQWVKPGIAAATEEESSSSSSSSSSAGSDFNKQQHQTTQKLMTHNTVISITTTTKMGAWHG